ncbi:MAG TPA: DUF3099 domain-containing protein [Arachnia sp.]|nr:DUF3099 domain-containing protein [Arachnia sp.]HMT85665.1 DUF3099 domain-containing protein [Arachnia sp.]
MASRTADAEAVVITTAPTSRTLDVETRQRRYLITMAVRTAGFLAFLVVPGWWKLVALAAAAILPVVAVLLANNSDHRPPPPVSPEEEPTTLLALPSGEVLRGTVEDEA